MNCPRSKDVDIEEGANVQIETEPGECARSRLVRNSVQTKCVRKIIEANEKSNRQIADVNDGSLGRRSIGVVQTGKCPGDFPDRTTSLAERDTKEDL